LLDHLIVIVFAVMYPVAGFIGFRRLLRKIDAGIPVNRKLLYLSTISWHWVLCVLALAVWAHNDRPWSTLGFSIEFDNRFLAGSLLTLAGIVVLILQLRQVLAAPQDYQDRLERELGHSTLIFPRNGSELLGFNLLSVTAGIVEEILWRGFLIWYLSQFIPVWSAVLISAVSFGVAHGYQGLAKIPQIALVGVALAGLYVLTGSLWLPMILHTALDLLQGRLVFEVLRLREPAS
jgi:membrane protease YdiL (CAAX protease family)